MTYKHYNKKQTNKQTNTKQNKKGGQKKYTQNRNNTKIYINFLQTLKKDTISIAMHASSTYLQRTNDRIHAWCYISQSPVPQSFAILLSFFPIQGRSRAHQVYIHKHANKSRRQQGSQVRSCPIDTSNYQTVLQTRGVDYPTRLVPGEGGPTPRTTHPFMRVLLQVQQVLQEGVGNRRFDIGWFLNKLPGLSRNFYFVLLRFNERKVAISNQVPVNFITKYQN
eukprot:TRINITY_DN3748_c0_g4_i1.p2 TRINITY_DN3748_c0_g4~~TRINITY_DN3748_c0_g4_i1.p2  ORF type:complete len:223 (-),score=-3.59 TRINITY_DN3748_c0_g4_i1:748-1416(-)